MPDSNDIATGATLDDYILNIADGIAKAQRELSLMAMPTGSGAAPITYQIPRIDFELRMTMDMQKEPAGAGSGLGRRLRIHDVRSSSQSSIASLIKGRFVAVPAHGGKPMPQIDLELDPEEDDGVEGQRVDVIVRLSNNAGEVLVDQEVQINIDRDLCKTLNEENGLAGTVSSKTFIENAIARTDDQGVAQSRLVIAAEEVPGTSIAVVVDAMGVTRTLIYRVRAAT